MSVIVRPYRRGGWEVDIRLVLPDNSEHRERRKAPVTSKSAAQRWGDARERAWYQELTTPPPKDSPPKEVPTLETFWPRFVDGYARANRQKPSGIAAKETIGNLHLIPRLGSKRLNAITTEHIQQLKRHLHDRSPKTVNNVLTVLSVLLKKAVEWDVIDRLPCVIRLLPIPKPSAGFYDFDEYARLIEAARSVDRNAQLIVLLGGDAGLRCGEMMALEWRDIDLQKRQLCVQRSDWKGHVTVPKGGRLRYVPLTMRLTAALRDCRHLRSDRVLCQANGSRMSADIVKHHVERAARRAALRESGVHRLRHTFCSHLAMRGAPARAIQELAGHQDLTTTQRYMHLSPAALDSAIRLLDDSGIPRSFGEMLETGSTETAKPFR
jgi:integrase